VNKLLTDGIMFDSLITVYVHYMIMLPVNGDRFTDSVKSGPKICVGSLSES